MSVRLQVVGRQASAPGTTGTYSVLRAPGQLQLSVPSPVSEEYRRTMVEQSSIHSHSVQSLSVPPTALGSASSPPASVSPFVSGTEKRLRHVELC